jgi:predicted GNAT family acetyltransferase
MTGRLHPLDRPAWSALVGRQAGLARGDPALAVRMDADFGMFAGAAESTADAQSALAGLIEPPQDLWLVEPEPQAAPPGLVVRTHAACWQMVAERLTPAPDRPLEVLPLGDADAPDMVTLAALTRPGPFFPRTHRLGDFIGLRQDGALVAMAGERLRPDGFTEVSGVCTHPDHRGRGYAGALMRRVAAKILARGETPFLHAYAGNTGAIALYESLGFVLRREVVLTVLGKD